VVSRAGGGRAAGGQDVHRLLYPQREEGQDQPVLPARGWQAVRGLRQHPLRPAVAAAAAAIAATTVAALTTLTATATATIAATSAE
jgi:hypothetical protein